MSHKAKPKKKRSPELAHNHNTAATQPTPATSEAPDPPTTSPNKLIAVLFGLPLAVIAAAVAFRLIVN